MDETTGIDPQATTANQPNWWQSLIGVVVNGAVQRAQAPRLSNGMMYYVDGAGNVIPQGQPSPYFPGMQATGNSPLVGLALLAVAAVVVYKLVK